MKAIATALLRLTALLLLATLALQLYFLARIALMVVVDPQSTTFQRSEAWRLLVEKHQILWSQQWVDYPRISTQLKRAVIASEDAGFSEHGGVEWDASVPRRASSVSTSRSSVVRRASGAPSRCRRARVSSPRSSAARRSRNNSPRTSSSAASAASRARARSSSSR
jgi:monofunctional glycosyltransferase